VQVLMQSGIISKFGLCRVSSVASDREESWEMRREGSSSADSCSSSSASRRSTASFQASTRRAGNRGTAGRLRGRRTLFSGVTTRDTGLDSNPPNAG
jgi:hypothetical protein